MGCMVYVVLVVYTLILSTTEVGQQSHILGSAYR